MPETPSGLTLDDVVSFPITLPNNLRSARAARLHLHDALSGRLAADVLQDVELMVSELVTNAVGNGRGACGLALTIPRPGVLRVAVSDRNQRRPALRRRDVASESGRGLQLIHSLALRWGHHGRAGSGNTVWFEVAAGGAV